jgi:acylphosphatase
MSAARFLVRGRVQGVFFRASTRERALALGLRGSAVNRADGSVEVRAAGDAQALDALERWLRHGPAQARVEGVQREPLDPDAVGEGFATG